MIRFLKNTFLYKKIHQRKHPHLYDKRFKYGIGTYGVNNLNVFLWKETDRIEIGKYCSISANVNIIASGEHFHERVSNFPFKAKFTKDGIEEDTKSRGPVIIGNDVWIGFGAVIFSGVIIGDGAVIGAGSYVFNHVQPYTIVGGVPAKLIRKRFSDNIIDKLEKIRWWDWDIELIKERISEFYIDTEKFVEKYLNK